MARGYYAILEGMNAPAPRRTNSLWVVSIGLLVLGLAGCACNSLGIAGGIMQQRLVREMSNEPAIGDAFDGPNGMMGKMEKWAPVTMGLAVGATLFSAFVLVCAVLVLIWNPSVPKIVPIGMYVTSAYTFLAAGLGVYAQYDMMSWTQEFAAEAGAGGGMDGFMGMSLGFSVCTAGGWAFLKIAFYVYAAMHLRKPEVMAMFGGQSPAVGPRGD